MLESTLQKPRNWGTLRSWGVVLGLALLFLLWGLFIFFAVGDKGPPSWNFGVIRDIPGESPYSTERPAK